MGQSTQDNRKSLLKQMFASGAHPQELKACLKQMQSQLMLKGARIRNLPKGQQQAADLISELSAEALELVCNWFATKTTFGEVIPLSDTIAKLKDGDFSDTGGAPIITEWRSLLSHFCKNQSNTEIVGFLGPKPTFRAKEGTPTGPSRAKTNAIDLPKDTSSTKKKLKESKTKSLRQKIDSGPIIDRYGHLKEVLNQPQAFPNDESTKPDPIRGEPAADDTIRLWNDLLAEESLPPTHDLTTLVLYGLVAVAQDDKRKEKLARSALSSDPYRIPEVELTRLLNYAKLKVSIKPDLDSQIIIAKKLSEVGAIDPEKSFALAKVTKRLTTGQIFARVIGILSDGVLIEISPNEAKTIYKFSGDITALPSEISDKHNEEEIGLWRVRHATNDKRNQFVATAFEARAYDLVSLPYTSGEPDRVRIWLQTEFKPRVGSFPIFKLCDGPTLRIPNLSGTPAGFGFEKPLELYESIDAFQLSNGSSIVLGPLPHLSGVYDCSPPTIWLRRLLKAHSKSVDFPPFTKAQVSELGSFIKDQEIEPLAPNLHLGIERLANLADLRSAINDCIGSLLKLPEVNLAIEDAKSELIKAFESRQSEEKAAIERLQRERRSLSEQIYQTNKRLKQQTEDLADAVRSAFERARDDGADYLGQVAVFQALIGNVSVSDKNSRRKVAKDDYVPDSTPEPKPLKSIAELTHAIGTVALRRGISSTRLTTAICASKACGVACLLGSKRREFLSAIAEVTAGSIVCQVSVGADIFSSSDLMRRPCSVTTPQGKVAMKFGDFLESQARLQRTSVIDILGANRAPLESYLPELMSAVTTQDLTSAIAWEDGEGNVRSIDFSGPVFLFLHLVSGDSTFPIPDPFSQSIPLIPLDFPWGDEESPDQSITAIPRNLTQEAIESLNDDLEVNSATNPQYLLGHHLLKLGLANIEASTLAAALLKGGRSKQNLGNIDGLASKVIEELDASKEPRLFSILKN